MISGVKSKKSPSPAVQAANTLTARWCSRLGDGDYALSGAGLWPLLALLASAADDPAAAELAAAIGRPAGVALVETEQQGVRMNNFQTAPPPEGSEWLWSSAGVLVEGTRATLRLPAGPQTLERGPWLMMDAIYRWGLAPWDLTLTFAPLPPGGTFTQ
jgi:hypothetical protein